MCCEKGSGEGNERMDQPTVGSGLQCEAQGQSLVPITRLSSSELMPLLHRLLWRTCKPSRITNLCALRVLAS